MRTRRSHHNQERLWKELGRQMARATRPIESDPDLWPCPNGEQCTDNECVRVKARFDAERLPSETLSRWYIRTEVRHENR